MQPHVDPSVWQILPVSRASIAPEDAGAVAVGWIVVYVEDVAIIADDPVIDLARDKIAQKWRNTAKPTVSFGRGRTVEYLWVGIVGAQ